MALRLSGKVLAFVRTERVARVATVGRNRKPHNVPVCTVAVNGRIYFASGRAAQKVHNIRSHPQVAVTFDRYSEDWKRLAGAMITGEASIIESGAQFRRARKALYRKYQPYARVAPIAEGESVIVVIKPTGSFSWGL